MIQYLKFYKNKSDFFVIFFFIFEKLGLVGPVKLKIKLVWPYSIKQYTALFVTVLSHVENVKFLGRAEIFSM